MTAICDTNFPIQEYILKDQDIKSPWISKGLKKSSKKKQKLHIKFLNTKSLEDEFKYKTYKNLSEKLGKKAKSTYYSNLLHTYKTDSKWHWQVRKNTTGNKKKIKFPPREIKVDKTIMLNSQDIAKEFNKFFTSVGPKLAKKIANTEEHFKTF